MMRSGAEIGFWLKTSFLCLTPNTQGPDPSTCDCGQPSIQGLEVSLCSCSATLGADALPKPSPKHLMAPFSCATRGLAVVLASMY